MWAAFDKEKLKEKKPTVERPMVTKVEDRRSEFEKTQYFIPEDEIWAYDDTEIETMGNRIHKSM
jgi:hypothetical protein